MTNPTTELCPYCHAKPGEPHACNCWGMMTIYPSEEEDGISTVHIHGDDSNKHGRTDPIGSVGEPVVPPPGMIYDKTEEWDFNHPPLEYNPCPPPEQELVHLDGQIKTLLAENRALHKDYLLLNQLAGTQEKSISALETYLSHERNLREQAQARIQELENDCDYWRAKAGGE